MREYSTEVGLLAIWDSKSLTHIITPKDYRDIFGDNKAICDLINVGKAVIWSTGGDGVFGIDIRFNPEKDLSRDEETSIEMKALNLKLIVTSGEAYVGTPECAGMEERGVKENILTKLKLEPGIYHTDIYFLYDKIAAEKIDKMTNSELREIIKQNPDFDKTGYILVLHKAEEEYEFPLVKDIPSLG